MLFQILPCAISLSSSVQESLHTPRDIADPLSLSPYPVILPVNINQPPQIQKLPNPMFFTVHMDHMFGGVVETCICPVQQTALPFGPALTPKSPDSASIASQLRWQSHFEVIVTLLNEYLSWPLCSLRCSHSTLFAPFPDSVINSSLYIIGLGFAAPRSRRKQCPCRLFRRLSVLPHVLWLQLLSCICQKLLLSY